jgi:DNA-directed RNA polymerase specialized sigma24 family protein
MTKDELRQYRNNLRLIRQIEQQIAELSADYPQITAYYGDEPRVPSRSHDPLADYIAAKHDLLAQYVQALTDKLMQQQRIEAAIMSLDGIEQVIMREVYIQGLRFKTIAVKESYNYRQVQRIHARALKKMSPNVPF